MAARAATTAAPAFRHPGAFVTGRRRRRPRGGRPPSVLLRGLTRPAAATGALPHPSLPCRHLPQRHRVVAAPSTAISGAHTACQHANGRHRPSSVSRFAEPAATVHRRRPAETPRPAQARSSCFSWSAGQVSSEVTRGPSGARVMFLSDESGAHPLISLQRRINRSGGVGQGTPGSTTRQTRRR